MGTALWWGSGVAAPGEGGREEAWRRGKSNRQLLLEVVQGVVACKVGVQVYASTWLYCTVLQGSTQEQGTDMPLVLSVYL